jgi:hypothetical protein
MSYAVIRISNVSIPKFGTDTCVEWLCFDEPEGTWFLSLEKHSRFEFDLKVDAENIIFDYFDDEEFLTVIPIAEKPLSAKAIESANYLLDQLQKI